MRDTTRDKWAKRVDGWRRSKLSVETYAARVGVNPKSLAWWKWQLESKPAKPAAAARRRAPEPTALSPLTFVEVTPTSSTDGLEIVLTTGTRIRVPADFDATVLVRLLDVLERRG
jgi:hypothetical protein